MNNKKITKILNFIKTTFQKQMFTKAVIALSGGLDSSTCLMLLAKSLGPKNVVVLKMPYEAQDMSHADLMLKLAKIPPHNIVEINIAPIVKSFLSTISYQLSAISNVRLGNIMVRVRMILTYDLAKAKQALVCGTENRSEYLLGYFTLFGDQAADFSPIQHLYKTQVRQLAGYLKVPQTIISKPATAGLWRSQTDEKELGFSYQEADQVLHSLLDEKLPIDQMLKKGLKKEVIIKVLTRVKANLYKHQIPYLLTN